MSTIIDSFHGFSGGKSKAPAFVLAAGIALAAFVPALHAADGLYGVGGGARAMGLGGAAVATPGGALGSMADNPAGLSLLNSSEADAGLVGASAYGRFSKAGSGGTLSDDLDVGPEGAVSVHVPSTPFTFGVGVMPQMDLAAHWSYVDPTGGLGGTTSYGRQSQASSIEELRFGLGMSIALTSKLSVGGVLGFEYNENRLQAPYIFQSQPVLRGFKTLLNLSTSGYGINGSAGILYRPTDTLSFGLSYTGRTVVSTYGEATGNASAQLDALGPGFAGVQRDFHYDAEVDNTFPQMITGGVAWKFLPKWEASAEVDWTGWSDAFDKLPVKLTNGNNAQINALVGSSTLEDDIPLGWKDEFTYRLGLEYQVTQNFTLRAGYSFSKSPVPDETLTPLTAALPQNTISAGLGYSWNWLDVDLAYEWDIPITRHINQSELLDGEYNDSSVQDGIQWLGVTTSMKF